MEEATPAQDSTRPLEQHAGTPGPAHKKRRTRLIILAGVAVVALAGIGYWLYARQFEKTDDAQIDGDISNLSPRVAGTVAAVYVVEGQRVAAGPLPAQLDPPA